MGDISWLANVRYLPGFEIGGHTQFKRETSTEEAFVTKTIKLVFSFEARDLVRNGITNC